MTRRLIGKGSDNSAAVAPTVALALFALIGAGGVAFDYARLANLDTEMQNAADQAALAAATQLDKQAGAIDRAIAAAQGLVSNNTLFANETGGIRKINMPDLVFYAVKANAEAANGINCPTAGALDISTSTAKAAADLTAKFVCVRSVNRVGKFALTPVVRVMNTGNISAMAVAGIGSALCKVPPLMMCNPQETGTNKDFDVSAYRGFGIRLVEGGGPGSSWAAGNFGYLQTGIQNGAAALEFALGANAPPGDCLAADGVTTKPGENTSVTDAINTRFDIYENGLTNNCTTGTCTASPNVRKDVVRVETSTNYGYNTGNDPWQLPTTPSNRYLPASAGTYPPPYPKAMGHPRDICHAVPVGHADYCTGDRIGNGVWDRNLYFFVNHRALYDPTATAPNGNWATGIPSLTTFAADNGITLANITRNEVYKWELASDELDEQSFVDSTGKGKSTATYFSYGRPRTSSGLPAGPTTADRRQISMAVINCVEQGVQGQAKNVTVVKWVDLFLVEPSLARDRTDPGDIYVEVIRQTTAGGNAPTNPQVVRRDVPYLIR